MNWFKSTKENRFAIENHSRFYPRFYRHRCPDQVCPVCSGPLVIVSGSFVFGNKIEMYRFDYRGRWNTFFRRSHRYFLIVISCCAVVGHSQSVVSTSMRGSSLRDHETDRRVSTSKSVVLMLSARWSRKGPFCLLYFNRPPTDLWPARTLWLSVGGESWTPFNIFFLSIHCYVPFDTLLFLYAYRIGFSSFGRWKYLISGLDRCWFSKNTS